jgi:hypothetical protein
MAKVANEVKETRVSTSRWISPCRLLSSNKSLRKDCGYLVGEQDSQKIAENSSDECLTATVKQLVIPKTIPDYSTAH